MNSDIKERFRSTGVKQWEVAAEIGVSEQTLIRWLRFPLSDDRRQLILLAVEKMEHEKKGGVNHGETANDQGSSSGNRTVRV